MNGYVVNGNPEYFRMRLGVQTLVFQLDVFIVGADQHAYEAGTTNVVSPFEKLQTLTPAEAIKTIIATILKSYEKTRHSVVSTEVRFCEPLPS